MARALSPKQVRICQTARRALGLEEEDYRAILRRCGKVESTRDLTQRGLTAVLAEFERLGWTNTSGGKPIAAKPRPGMATEPQLALIRASWREWSGGEPAGPGLRTWLKRTAGVEDLRFLDLDGAQAAIAGLRAMCARMGVDR